MSYVIDSDGEITEPYRGDYTPAPQIKHILPKAQRDADKAQRNADKAHRKAMKAHKDAYKVVQHTSTHTTTFSGPVIMTGATGGSNTMTFNNGYSKYVVNGYTIEVTERNDGKTHRKIIFPDGHVEEKTYDGPPPPVIF